MKPLPRFLSTCLVSVLPLALSFSVAMSASAQAKSSLFAQAQSVTDANPNEPVEAKVWLNLHQKQSFDKTVAALYQEGSPTYHQWLKPSDLAQFSPTAADVNTIKQQLINHGLTVTAVGSANSYIKISGTVAAMQAAFQTQIKTVVIKGKSMHAAVNAPKLAGNAGSLIAAVTGLTQTTAHLDIVRAADSVTGKPYAAVVGPTTNGIYFSRGCFRSPEVQTFKTPGAAFPTATYAGNRYGANISNTTQGTLAPCGYDVANFTTAYGMDAAYKKGLNGAGQTIVIIDADAQPTIRADANTFSQLNGLPPLTSSNFKIIYPEGRPTTTDPDSTDETSLDVEWAHAIAPGAKIDLVLANGLDFPHFEGAVAYAILHKLGSVISNSYGTPEALADAQDISIENLLSEIGAALGISVNYSSGDYGDNVAYFGVKTVSMPADSPYSTAVGGTSLAIDDQNKMKFQTGWGNNLTLIEENGPAYPPQNAGFYLGSGGGESAIFAQPEWQRNLPGSRRQLPDVSLDGDPFTGVEFIVSSGGVQYIGVAGGTSLSCPAFSAIWAIANQRASQLHGKKALLGQAAPTMARLAGTTALTDVTAYSSPTNVAGIVFTKQGANIYSPNQLVEPLQNTRKYVSALWNDGPDLWLTVSFGTDSSLTTGAGWDNVTGFGTPNGLDFINAAAK